MGSDRASIASRHGLSVRNARDQPCSVLARMGRVYACLDECLGEGDTMGQRLHAVLAIAIVIVLASPVGAFTSPNGTVLVSCDEAGTPTGAPANGPWVAADAAGRFVAYHKNGDIYLKDVSTGALINLQDPLSGQVWDKNPAISGDGTLVVFESYVYRNATNFTEFRSYNTNDGTWGTVPGCAGRDSVSYDGRYILYSDGADYRRYDRLTSESVTVSVDADGTSLRASFMWSEQFTSAAMSDDGSRVAIQTSKRIFLKDLNTGELRYLTDQYSSDVDPVVISGNGQVIAYAHNGAGGYQVYVYDLDVGQPELVSVSDDGVPGTYFVNHRPSISDDGRYVCYWTGSTNVTLEPNPDSDLDAVVFDRVTRKNRWVSRAFDGGDPSGQWLDNSFCPVITGSGNAVVYAARNPDVVYPGVSGMQIYRHDMASNPTRDFAPPLTSATTETALGSVSFSLTATDPAGVDECWYRVNEEPVESYTQTVTVQSESPVTVEFGSIDTVGNREASRTITLEPLVTTTLSLSRSNAYPAYGAATTLSAVLRGSGASPLGGQPVVFERYYSGRWYSIGSGVTNSSGVALKSATPFAQGKTTYRASFVGAKPYLACSSLTTSVIPKVSLTNPAAPTNVSRSKTFNVTGRIKPRHAVGSYPVRIYKQRYVNGKWRPYGYVKAKASYYSSSASRYAVSMSLPYRGKWRLRAYAMPDSRHAATWSSGYDSVLVR